MKALLFLAVSALFADCAPSDYIIKGKAGRHFEGRTVYLQTLDGSTLDSCVVKDGMFTIDGQVIEARLGGAPRFTNVGYQVRIKYLPEKPKHAIIIK